MYKLLIVDDHPAIRMAIRLLFENENYSIIGEASNGADAILATRRNSPHLIILDISIPKLDGLEVITRLKSLRSKSKILVFTQQSSALFASRCFQAGAMGFVEKRDSPSELLLAAKAVLSGYVHFPKDALRSITRQSEIDDTRMLASLTNREMIVLQHLVKGTKNKVIAKNLFLSDKTVSTYKSRIMIKINASCLADIIDFARRHELI
ncbi:TPA: response regulator [Pseudomonas aeruginosa]|uniref:response regulator transcription factor n=1 Tax=Pseudomonas TaxID=286 RepID=UPI0003B9C59A|nr:MULTISPECIES: response regulator transcription factor [Pseudomonas]EKV6259727.1 response regulator transcription factor [Pseudomonas aeruginosa]ERV62312.1 two-component system response regulator [Pseudomonas aeruginosa BL07]ERV68309.1 two-component system response regulator [Pseudomonas aeruginosa BL07]MBG7167536.1 response regulator transcription factor [Pseudomonas aeruginosa]MBH8778590.1 response regulator transcription factor [Pseudomonas aeruginosa]